MIQTHFFYFFSCTAILTALGVVFCRSVLRSVLFLLATVFLMARLFVLLKAFYLASFLTVVYTGGIVGLIIFSMLRKNTGKRMSDWRIFRGRGWTRPALAIAAGVILFRQFLNLIPHLGPDGPISQCSCRPAWWKTLTPDFQVGAQLMGRTLFNRYLLPFELVSLLVLGAILGIIALARKDLS